MSKQLPDSNIRAGHKFVKDLTMLEGEAKDIVASKRNDWSVSFDITEEEMKSAKKELMLVEGFMAALRRHKA